VTDPDPRRRAPRTDALLADRRLQVATERLGAAVVKRAVATALDRVRAGAISPQSAADEAVALLPVRATSLTPVINATGVVLHTNLGRAALSDAALEAIHAAAGYVDVEFDLSSGHRAPRGAGAIEALLRAAPEAGSALVVNNGAAALVLVTTALAAGREVIVSRGELVEIGDGFRLPALIESTGARLREVGTTNRVAVDDYAAAVGPDTACILKVHPSNFRIEGFTRAVSVDALSQLGPPVVLDVGSGLLHTDLLLPDEPAVASALRAGASLVTCSGDKLLGGPQAGLILGDADLITRIRRHPLARAVRVDKLTLAALEATLIGPPTPTSRYLHADPDALRARCEGVAAAVRAVVDAAVVPSDGAVGGGGAPGQRLPGWAVSLPAEHAQRLRRGDPPVVGRIERDRCLLDLRCVPPEHDKSVIEAVLSSASGPAPD
jgi:L-seryl-tRNA(Ser) seleniumtransferase